MKTDKHICPKCKSMRSDSFSFEKKFDPKWRTLEKGKRWQCRICGFIKEEI